jgi:hypothetical protein
LSDAELCEAAKKAGEEMRKKLVAAAMSGDTSPAMFKDILTELNEKVTTLAASGGDGELVTALKEFGAEVAKAASAADPAAAIDNPNVEKAGKRASAACKAAGVTVVF